MKKETEGPWLSWIETGNNRFRVISISGLIIRRFISRWQTSSVTVSPLVIRSDAFEFAIYYRPGLGVETAAKARGVNLYTSGGRQECAQPTPKKDTKRWHKQRQPDRVGKKSRRQQQRAGNDQAANFQRYRFPPGHPE